MPRLAIISSHPIQYNAPLFRLLAKQKNLEIQVFYSWHGTQDQIDPEFHQAITWDIPLLDGYQHQFIDNKSTDPGTHHFSGLNNPDMIQRIQQWKADSVLVYGWAWKTHFKVMRFFHGKIPVYFRGDSTLLTGGNKFRQILRAIWLRIVYQYVDIAFFPGQQSKQYFLTYGLKKTQLIHVPHSIENSRFQHNAKQLSQDANEIKKSLGIESHALTLLFAGKFVARKQPTLLLDAMIEIAENSPKRPLHLIFAGTGPLENSLKKSAHNKSYIHFIGFKNQTEMPLTYHLGDVFILPSTLETWGLAINEAMICGKPVIVSDKVGCAPDLVIEGKTGFTFQSQNKNHLIDCINHFMEDSKLSTQLGQHAKEHIINNWSPEQAASIISQTLHTTP